MEFLIPISMFAMIVAVVYLHYRRKERMAIIERGLDLKHLYDQPGKINLFPSLKYGLLLVFLGIGLLIANILVASEVMQEEPAYFSLSSLSVGLALLIYYFAAGRLIRQAESEQENKTQD